MINYFCFIWTQGTILKPAVFWPRFGSNEYWVCQLLIKYVNDKSPESQEETEYASCWRWDPIVLFPLKSWKDDKTESKTDLKEKASRWTLFLLAFTPL
jgi:hypothetical protein